MAIEYESKIALVFAGWPGAGNFITNASRSLHFFLNEKEKKKYWQQIYLLKNGKF